MQTLIQRREFLGVMGAAVSGLALCSCGMNPRALLPLRPVLFDYNERRLPTICTQCDGGCGIVARIVDGRVVKLDGNVLNPINRGRLCAMGQAGPQLLYHPDRFRSPMQRSRGKGSGQWRNIGWDEAIGIVAGQLQVLRDRGEPQSLLVLDGGPQNVERMLWSRFCDAFGTPNYFPIESPDNTPIAAELMHGEVSPFSYDLENSNYILSFGCDLLDGGRWSAYMRRVYGYLRHERPGNKAKLVQIDRRFSNTAAKADEWIPAKPMTEGALALGIAHVIVRDALYDKSFAASTSGFEDFKTLVLQDYCPGFAAEVTGVPADTIVRIAREFAKSRPAVAISDACVTSCPNGVFAALAIHALNALAGSIDVAGGVSLPLNPQTKALPALKLDDIAEAGRSMPRIVSASIEAVPEAVQTGKPYPLRAVFLRDFDPVASCRMPSRFREALETVPLIVSFSSFPDSSSEIADLILPDHVYLEKWLGVGVKPASGVSTCAVAQPVIEPLYGTMQTEDFLLKLVHRLEDSVAQVFPWQTFKDVLRDVEWSASSATEETRLKTTRTFEFCPEILKQAAFSSGDETQYKFFVNLTGLDRINCAGPVLPWIQELSGMARIGEAWGEINPHAARDLGIGDGDWIWIETQRGRLKARAKVYAGAMPGVISVPVESTGIKNILNLEYEQVSGAVAWLSTRANIYRA